MARRHQATVGHHAARQADPVAADLAVVADSTGRTHGAASNNTRVTQPTIEGQGSTGDGAPVGGISADADCLAVDRPLVVERTGHPDRFGGNLPGVAQGATREDKTRPAGDHITGIAEAAP
jgi:hypothetical protein